MFNDIFGVVLSALEWSNQGYGENTGNKKR